MANYELPSPERAYNALRFVGDPFAGYADVSVETALTYEHHSKGTRNIRIDPRALGACDVVYADGEALTDALYMHGAREVAPIAEAEAMMDGYLSDDPNEMIWSVTGFATPGKPYTAEAPLMRELFAELIDKDCPPALVVNGGLRPGVLGLSSVIAKEFVIPTVGFAPRQGLGEIAPQDRLVIAGPTYKSRQVLVGSAADVITVWGGRDGTREECEAGVDRGACVLIMEGRDYEPEDMPHSYYTSEKLRDAYHKGQIVKYHHKKDNLSEKIDEVRAAVLARPDGRELRRAVFPGLLKKLG